jgi:pimeloyl-ACP methyl ester carboxylesterase
MDKKIHCASSGDKIGWRVNLDVIHEAFEKDIAVFPLSDFDEKVTFNGETLFIGGSDSDYIPVNDHPDILEQFPRSKFEYIAGAGHWVHSQKPNEFLEVLLKFIQNK